MWSLSKASPFGRLSIRNICMFATATLVAIFFYMLLAAPTAHAADADWNGSSIMYKGNEYVKIADAKAGDSHGLPAGTQIYAYAQPSVSSPSSPITKAHLIYFAPGTDPTKATSATYVAYDFTPPGTYKNPSGKATISLQPQSTASAGTTSCDSRFTSGIGYIICPITNFLAGAMDNLFSILSSFLTVRPVQTSQENALYRAWSYMRNFANVAFVIGFLIIIYSQLTSVGLSNYDLKKMLPRLIVAAILVNISYWICAAAIDISNVLGYSIQDIFISMRKGLVGDEGNGWDVLSFKSVAGAVLSGGTAVAATGAGAYGLLLSAGSVGAALYMLLPILVGVLIAVLVALLVMAARQAIITILVIVAPLAFVAYLLPGTEKYFKKWHELGMTMLLMFPIFSVIFGGSQLAGLAIIQNADSINMIIIGMAVQVAPVVVTPLLIKFSGSLLARIGGMVNNPGKGLIDRTRQWSEEKRDQRKAAKFASPLNRRRDGIARLARNIDHKRRKREGNQKADEALADAHWARTQDFSDIQQKNFSAARMKDIGEADAETRYNAAIRTNAALQGLELDARTSKLNLDRSKVKVEAVVEEFKAGDARSMVVPDNLSVSALASYAHQRNNLARAMQETARDTTVVQDRVNSAQRSQSAQITQELLKNTAQIDGQTLREYGGGILGETGAGSVFSGAVAKYRGEYGERIKEKVQLLHHFNPDAVERQKLALGEDIEVERQGVRYTFSGKDDYAREAAIEEQLQKGSFSEIQAILSESGEHVTRIAADGSTVVEVGKTHEYRTSISEDVKQFGLDKKAIFFGSQTINDIAQGKIDGEPGLNMAAARSLATGKVSDEAVSGMNGSALQRLFSVTVDDIRRSEAYQQGDAATRARLETDFRANQQGVQYSAWNVMHNTVLSRNADQAAKEVLVRYQQEPPPSP